MRRLIVSVMPILLLMSEVAHAQRYTGPDGRLRVALAKQPFLQPELPPVPTRWPTVASSRFSKRWMQSFALKKPPSHRKRRLSMGRGNVWGWRWVISLISLRRMSRMVSSPLVYWLLALQCRDSLLVCNTQDRDGNLSELECCGSTLT